MWRKWERYIFKEQNLQMNINISLCGSHYTNSDKKIKEMCYVILKKKKRILSSNYFRRQFYF